MIANNNYSPPSNVSYFYGRISRDEAIPILNKRGAKTGLYLLRERLEETGSYSLSVCFNGDIHHYKIDRQEDGTVRIDRGRAFIGPVELVKHHQNEVDGLVTKLTIPCDRPKNLQPIYYLFINNSEFYMLVEKEIKNQMLRNKSSSNPYSQQYQQELTEARGRFRYKYEKIVLKSLHLSQTWFKSNLNREGANELLMKSGLKNGKFLIRSSPSSSNDRDIYKMSVSFNNEIKHYRIHTIAQSNNVIKYALEGGREFDTLIHLVDYYYRCSDGLADKLREACISKSSFVLQSTSIINSSSSSSKNLQHDNNNLVGQRQTFTSRFNTNGLTHQSSNSNGHSVPPATARAMHSNKQIASSEVIYDSNRMYEELLHKYHQNLSNLNSNNDMSSNVATSNGYLDDEPHNPNDITDLKHVPEVKRAIFEEDENYAYDTAGSHIFNIDIKSLELFDKLGSGCFGSVSRGLYKVRDRSGTLVTEMPVAIKTLNVDEGDDSKSEIRKEAEIMSKLNFPHIIKFIGMCTKANCIMIVLELAKLGPLHKYLRIHKEMQMKKIVKICYQVALAMDYLSKQNLVHRDLAARNVLLVTEELAKVSDFGMSRKMNESLYYPSKTQGKWPLKWYPPEASLTYRFDQKSDVWSFGVTCWEATSYGNRPYQGIDVNILLLRLENGDRLEKPANCPDDVYALMHKCWHRDKEMRPSFEEIVLELKKIFKVLYGENL